MLITKFENATDIAVLFGEKMKASYNITYSNESKFVSFTSLINQNNSPSDKFSLHFRIDGKYEFKYMLQISY